MQQPAVEAQVPEGRADHPDITGEAVVAAAEVATAQGLRGRLEELVTDPFEAQRANMQREDDAFHAERLARPAA